MESDAILDLKKTLSDSGFMQDMVKEVLKATNNSTGFSTRQSLSKQVSDLTVRKTPLFDMLPREGVINPIHQWDAITAISNTASFAGPIDTIGNDADPTITRYSEAVRYYRNTTTVGQFTQAMSRPELPAQQVVDEKAIKAIIYDIEGDLFTGGAGADNIRGLNNVIATFSPAGNTISQGAALTSLNNIDALMQSMVENGSLPSHIWFTGSDMNTFNRLFTNLVRYNDTAERRVNKFGYAVRTYLSAFGEIDVMWDFFIPAKAGATPVSTAYVTDISDIALGEPTVNGASGVAMQDLAKTGPQNVKLINYYGLLIYRNVNSLARLTNIQ